MGERGPRRRFFRRQAVPAFVLLERARRHDGQSIGFSPASSPTRWSIHRIFSSELVDTMVNHPRGAVRGEKSDGSPSPQRRGSDFCHGSPFAFRTRVRFFDGTRRGFTSEWGRQRCTSPPTQKRPRSFDRRRSAFALWLRGPALSDCLRGFGRPPRARKTYQTLTETRRTPSASAEDSERARNVGCPRREEKDPERFFERVRRDSKQSKRVAIVFA